jgi:RNA 2',3'-cyclic 3'-phosphodiesterase
MATIRTFICFELPAQIRESIAELQRQLKPLGSGVGWTRPDGIHLTLKFLGDVESSRIDSIAEAVEHASQGCAAFPVTVAESGAFPNLARPRVIWVGIRETSGKLMNLQSRIEEELARLGYPREERRFSPHLTLGRIKAPESVQGICKELQQRGFAPQSFTATTIIIMRSDLKSDGAEYAPLRSIEL